MTQVADLAQVRAKNAGPFWLTIDIFCPDEAHYAQVAAGLGAEAVARAFGCPPADMRRFELPDLLVVKFSLPRPVVQGSPEDRDMHGAAWAEVVRALPLAPSG